jgi:hypothetical protein
MKANPLRANWELVRLTESALRHGTEGLGSLPAMLKELLGNGAWQRFEVPSGEVIIYERFTEFVVANPPRGLGADTDLVRRNVAHDPMALDLLDQALQNPPALHNIQGRAPTGTSKDAALRRLRKDRPDLHAEVLAQRLSAHAAMVEAGFRKRTLTVPIDPARIASTLRRHLSPEQLAQLVAALSSDDP